MEQFSSIIGLILLKSFARAAPPIHADCSGGRERLELEYRTVSTVTDPEAPPKTLLPQLLDHQESHRRAEIESRVLPVRAS